MSILSTPTRNSALIATELDQKRKNGPLKSIVIPPCPALLRDLKNAMGAAEPDLNEVARIAGSDVAMSATLLRNANGAMFASGQPVHTVGQAMNRLGLRESAALMTAFLVRHAIPVNHPKLRDFWDEASQSAGTLHFIARQLPGLSPELAQLYGLFQHVGMPVLLQSLRGYGGTLTEAAARKDRPFIATENANHRTDHAVVGALVAQAWHLPANLVAAIRLHHDNTALSDNGIEPEARTLVAAGLLADRMRRLRLTLPPDADWQAMGQQALDWLGSSEQDLEEWLQMEQDQEAAAA